VISEVILSQSCYINMALIRSGHGLLCIDSKSNKLQKKEVHFMFTEIGCCKYSYSCYSALFMQVVQSSLCLLQKAF